MGIFTRELTENEKRNVTIKIVKSLLDLLIEVDPIYAQKNHSSCFEDCAIKKAYDLISALESEEK